MSAESRKGSSFERLVADFLKFYLRDTRIDRRVKTGRKDRGDIGGVRTVRGADVVIEVKNHNRHDLAGWLEEARVEAGNADAPAGVVVFKRRGVGDPAKQYVLMDVATFAWLLEGGPDDEPLFEQDPHTRVIS